jgi:hypothetical protein
MTRCDGGGEPTPGDSREAYFARVVPLIGEGLRQAVVAVSNIALTARVVELLASCRLQRVVARGALEPIGWPLPELFNATSGCGPDAALEVLRRHLAWKNGFAPVDCRRDGGHVDLELAGELCPPEVAPHIVRDEARNRVTLHVPAGDLWAYLNVSYAVARRARELLLGRAAWPSGVTYLGSQLWPFTETFQPLPAPEPSVAIPPGRHVLVIGAGSVGSELVRQFRGEVAAWTLVDDATVSVYNPQRQWFGTEEIGEPKVKALARRLMPALVRAVPLRLSSANLPLLETLLEEARPDAAVLATGTADDACVAALLNRRGIPHVVAYAYPGARFFEVTAVAEGSPCLHCYRGNLYRGLESQTPMPDEVARFLYREPSESERERAFVNLVAEPATAIETGRIADVAALCLREMLVPPGRQRTWFRRILDAGTNCLLGGNVVEQRGEGETAYGLTYAGQVVRLGLEDIAGAEDHLLCPDCGRSLRVVHSTRLPGVELADADAAWLPDRVL